MKRYFERTDLDRDFYDRWIGPRLPARVFDVHVHLNLPEHVTAVTEERRRSDWAIECGYVLPCEDAHAAARELFPGVQYRIAGFPWPIREADLAANNRYLAAKGAEGLLTPFMAVRPEWEPERVEEELVAGGFVGFKPYPDMVSGAKGAEIGIFDFLPREQWAILDRHRKAVMLHLPRGERIASPDNLRELLAARQAYPRVTIIIAHFGRSFCPYYLERALEELGEARAGFYFDTAAVINPAVYDLALERLSPSQVLFGTDLPILFWHGRRTWTEREYRNLCREAYSWNRRHEPPEVEAAYTLFLYEEVRAILDAADRHGLSPAQLGGVFGENAARLLAPAGSAASADPGQA
ncbi:MAG: amidohydrolase family protein [Spirochaetales bacterium]|nr:amidohydrolase family protein [Spirochaetales bacterium]